MIWQQQLTVSTSTLTQDTLDKLWLTLLKRFLKSAIHAHAGFLKMGFFKGGLAEPGDHI